MSDSAMKYNDYGVLEITDKAVLVLSNHIKDAWVANFDYIYALGTDSPDPEKLAEVAAKASGAVLCEWLMHALESTK